MDAGLLSLLWQVVSLDLLWAQFKSYVTLKGTRKMLLHDHATS